MHTHALTEAGRTGATLAYNTLSEDTEGRGTEKDLTRKQARSDFKQPCGISDGLESFRFRHLRSRRLVRLLLLFLFFPALVGDLNRYIPPGVVGALSKDVGREQFRVEF